MPCFNGTLAPTPANMPWATDARLSSSEAEFGNATEMKKTANIAMSMDASHVVTYIMSFLRKNSATGAY